MWLSYPFVVFKNFESIRPLFWTLPLLRYSFTWIIDYFSRTRCVRRSCDIRKPRRDDYVLNFVSNEDITKIWASPDASSDHFCVLLSDVCYLLRKSWINYLQIETTVNLYVAFKRVLGANAAKNFLVVAWTFFRIVGEYSYKTRASKVFIGLWPLPTRSSAHGKVPTYLHHDTSTKFF